MKQISFTTYFFSLLLVFTFISFSGCEDDDGTPACDLTDLNDVLSGKTWRAEGGGEVITFNADGSMDDGDGLFTPTTATTTTWVAVDSSFTASYIDGSGSGSFSTTAQEISCDRVSLPDFTGNIVLIRQ
ncbi:MAG: hypothetical protein AAF828_05150 [Bacteroidota bacterium]